ncbi:MAG: sigma-70 region 4 domain-containing protein, partial [Myxococcota bacterium]
SSSKSTKTSRFLGLIRLEDRSGPEVAEAVGCTVNTVWTRLHHARKEFSKIGRRLGLLDDGASR